MDNTVGSLTQSQKSVIIGSILGDGYLRILPGRRNAFLEINHALSQRDYVDWIYNKLTGVVAGFPKERQGNGMRRAYRFYTRQSAELTALFHFFYQEGKKVIPAGFNLDPLALSVWFMDDGSRCRASDIYLNTQQFDKASQQHLLDALAKLGLQATLNKDKHYQRIRFLKKSIPRLFSLIRKYVIPSMTYKLGYDPVETTRRSPTKIVG